jgi:ribosomal protein S27AE
MSGLAIVPSSVGATAETAYQQMTPICPRCGLAVAYGLHSEPPGQIVWAPGRCIPAFCPGTNCGWRGVAPPSYPIHVSDFHAGEI